MPDDGTLAVPLSDDGTLTVPLSDGDDHLTYHLYTCHLRNYGYPNYCILVHTNYSTGIISVA